MEKLSLEVSIERRLCVVHGDVGYFLGFEQYSDVVEPSLLQGGYPGGTYSRVYGLVEFASEQNLDQTFIERVSPVHIKFIDREAADILRSIQERVGSRDEER